MFKNERRGTIYVMISALTYGLIGYFGMNIINSGVSVSDMLFWRFFLASIIMSVIMLPKIRSIGKVSDIIKLFVLGGITYCVTAFTYFVASEYIGTGLAIVIFFTYPIFVALINYFFLGIRITKKYLISIALILIGMSCLVQLEELQADLIGILLSVVSAFFYAVHVVSTKQIKMPSTVSTFIIVFGSAIVSLFMALGDNTLSIPSGTEFLINISGLTILCTVVPVILMLEGLKHISSIKASILTVFEPIVVFVLGVILLGEQVSLLQTCGAIIILFGCLITMVDSEFLKRVIVRSRPKPPIF